MCVLVAAVDIWSTGLHGVMQVYFGMSLSLQDMAGAVYVNQAVGFAIESGGCGLALLVMTRLGCRVTVAYSILQGQLLHCLGGKKTTS